MTNILTPTASFDIRNFQDQLQPAKEKGKYICPVCKGHNFSIVPENGKYSCFNGCKNEDIREAVSPWANRKGTNYTASPKKNSHQPKKLKPKPVPTPDNFTLVQIEPPIAIPVPQELLSNPPKGIPGKGIQTIYPYSDSQRVIRYQWEDASKEKGYSKTFRQQSRQEDGGFQMKKGDKPWPAYRINEAIAASKLMIGTPALLQHEGEGCVEIGRANGLAGFTFQGSCWNKESITSVYQRLKDEGIKLIIFPYDADDAGLKKLATCQDCAAEVGIALIGINPHDICPDLPYKSSDIKEILRQMEVPEFILRLEREIHAAIALEEYENDLDDVTSEPKTKKEVRKEWEKGRLGIARDVIEDHYEGRVRLNELTSQVEKDDKNWITDRAYIQLCKETGFETSKNTAIDIIAEMAANNSYHPVRDYINSLRTSDATKHVFNLPPVHSSAELIEMHTSKLNALWTAVFGRELSSIAKVHLTKAFVGAVNRVLEPGCQMRAVLVLFGAQLIGKSTFIREMCPFPSAYSDSYMGTKDKDDLLNLHCGWIHELAEIDSIYKKTDTAMLKAIISARQDKIRKPYERMPADYQRQCILIGTSNRQDFLRDVTGDTRFWTIPLQEAIDIKLLISVRDEIWAHLTALYDLEYVYWLNSDEQAETSAINAGFTEVDPIFEFVENHCTPFGGIDERLPRICTQEIWDAMNPDKVGAVPDSRTDREVRNALTKLGYRNMGETKIPYKGKRVRGWEYVPSKYPGTQPAGQVPGIHTQQGIEGVFEALSESSRASAGHPYTAMLSGTSARLPGDFINFEKKDEKNSASHQCDAEVKEVEEKFASQPGSRAEVGETLTVHQCPVAAHPLPGKTQPGTMAKLTAIAIEDPHNDNYEPKVGDAVIVTSALIAGSIGERHTIAAVLSNKGIQVRYEVKNLVGKKEEKAASLERDEYTPA